MFPKKNTPRWLIIVFDLGISLVSLVLAYLIRFDIKAESDLWEKEFDIVKYAIPVFLFIRFIVFYAFSIHKGIVRHTSTSDFKRLFVAISISSFILFILGILRAKLVDGYYLFPISVVIIEYVFCFFLTSVSRFIVKLIYLESVKSKSESQKIIIYGAGVSGLIAKRMIEKDAKLEYEVVCFLDDNKRISGNRIEGTEVIHTSKLEALLAKQEIKELIIAIQEPDEDKRRMVVETCMNYQVAVKKVPNPKSWINGTFSTKQIGQVRIEDLLGRKPIELNQDMLASSLGNQVILVTGAAGSIGSGIVRQLLKYKPAKIVLLDQAESPIYELEHELAQAYPDAIFESVIADISNFTRLENVFVHFKPVWVFHAAAYKHVPLMELNPSEAVRNNIVGTDNLVQLAVAHQVKKFVMISTDKAVNPTNVMGTSKRICEMIAQKANNKQVTQFITTRFGNVLGSNGSVIPLFKRQIEQGGPITVTDERITRFFMTIPEACQLVLEAGVMGTGGEIYVFDMGESVKIVDLAKNMIRLSGLELGKDIEIKFTGLRPGEKLYEELLNDNEDVKPTHHPKILIAKEREVPVETFELIKELVALKDSKENFELVALMKKIVPEYISNNSEFGKLDKK